MLTDFFPPKVRLFDVREYANIKKHMNCFFVKYTYIVDLWSGCFWLDSGLFFSRFGCIPIGNIGWEVRRQTAELTLVVLSEDFSHKYVMFYHLCQSICVTYRHTKSQSNNTFSKHYLLHSMIDQTCYFN